MGWP